MRCRNHWQNIAALSIHHPGMDLQPHGERLHIPSAIPTTKLWNFSNKTDSPRLLCIHTCARDRAVQKAIRHGCLQGLRSPGGNSFPGWEIPNAIAAPAQALPILLNSCELVGRIGCYECISPSIYNAVLSCVQAHTHPKSRPLFFFLLSIFTVLPSLLRSSRDAKPSRQGRLLRKPASNRSLSPINPKYVKPLK